MIIKFIDPISKNEIIEDLDDTTIDIAEYTANIHKTLLCKDICNGENCKIWIKINEEFILAGIQD
jgi:hypothetical protein